MEVCFDGLDEELQGVSSLLSAGFDNAEQCLDEAAARRALGSEAELRPDDRVTQRSLGRIVGRLDQSERMIPEG